MVKVENRLQALGEEREIASMYENVAIWHVDLTMVLVGVAEKDEAQCGACFRRLTRPQVRSHTLISNVERILGNIRDCFLAEEPVKPMVLPDACWVDC